MKTEKISEMTTNRLSVYLRCLDELAADGIETVSSQALADKFNLNSAQIRKDLAYFGEFGVRGVGYYVDDLRRTIMSILGLEAKHRVAIIGLGNLGTALANYQGLNREYFEVAALFDSDPAKIGTRASNGILVQAVSDMKDIIRDNGIDIVVIAVPAVAAESVLESVTDAGVRAVLNFAPIRLHPKPGVKVMTVDLTISLESLSYFLAHPTSDGKNIDYRDFHRYGADPVI